MSLLHKAFNLSIRILARPIITWVVNHKKDDLVLGESKYGILGKCLVGTGQQVNTISTKINRKIFGLSELSEIKALTEKQALEKGTEFITELFIYFLLIFIPINEWRKQSKAAEIKEAKETEYIESLIQKIKELKLQSENLEETYENYNKEYMEVKKRLINREFKNNKVSRNEGIDEYIKQTKNL